MRKLLAGLIVLFTAGTISLTTASPAQAAGWIGPCHGVSIICLAEHVNGGGIHWRTSLPYARCVGVPSNLNDRVSSLWNKYGWDSSSPPLQLTGYKHNPCRERMYTWGPSAYVLNIGSLNNDVMSAVCLGPRWSDNNPPYGYCPEG